MKDPMKDPMKKFAVFGNPIDHSLSPYIHSKFSQQAGIKIDYKAIKVLVDEFEPRVHSFFAAGGSGLNITIPHKRAAWLLADIKEESAETSQTANTLYLHDHNIGAANTDGAGLIKDLCDNLNWQLEGASLALLGAGGAARSVLPALASTGVERIILSNRTSQKAHQLVEDLSHLPLSHCELDQLHRQDYSILINATSVGLTGEIDFNPAMIHSELYCYDMVYRLQTATDFIEWAKHNGALAVADGLGMLVEQAALSYKIWHGVIPDTAELIKALRRY